ncbi:MAG TPA: adenylate/guanylate cyclase domain-containing protein [Acidimicrobiia bacterium]|nr:adenylate/guanylate cyclase domain-containing protein [Acidimicrobiia bacterium]
MAELPTGTVTFLFTDLEVSTWLWDREPDEMSAAMARHDAILHEAVTAHGGTVVKGRGDGLHAVFAIADGAVGAAVDAQGAIGAAPWEVSEPLRVRIGIHSGVAELRDGDYFGSAVNRAARLQALAHGGQILCSQSTADLVRDSLPGTVELADLGEHTLRDLSRPERVFQVSTAGLELSFAPLRSVGAFPGNLPVQVTSFVGRRDELAQLSEVLGENRMVTITGTGGVGKTRVAVQLAAELLERAPDGAWLFELAAVTDTEAMVQLVATTLSVRPRPGLSSEGAVLELLRSKRALVVLDNCEHLLDGSGRLAEGMIRECEHVRVVATSREALGIAGERVWPLRSLPVPGAVSPDAVEASDAGRLFRERAESARPGFVIDAGNAAAVAEICRRLDGIPLAIQLAAARIVAMTPTEIAGLLDERFRLLTGGRRAEVERHRTLRATVDWSYGLLEPADRLLFDRLGVFAGTFDAVAAAAVTAGGELETWDVIDGLSSLVAKSMLVADVGPADTMRYQMLETLREHARERLDLAGDADAFRRRHAQHYARFAAEAGAALAGRDELAWRPRVNAERDNLRAAVYWALDRDDEDDTLLALRIIAALAYEAVIDPPGGIGAWAERAFDVALRSTARERTAVIGAAAQQAAHLAQFDLAMNRVETELQGALDADSIAPGLVPFVAWSSLYGQGKHAEAAQVEVEAVHRLEQAGTDPFGLVMFHTGVSYYAAGTNDLVTARAEAESALELARRIENPSAIGSALFNFGRAIEHDDPVRALDAHEQAIALGRAGAMPTIVGLALVCVARLRARMHDRVGALEALDEAISHGGSVGARPVVVDILGASADILVRVAEPSTATVVAASLLEGALVAINVSSQRNAELERTLDAARRVLGHEQYQRSYAHGASISYEEVVEFALDNVRRALAQPHDG